MGFQLKSKNKQQASDKEPAQLTSAEKELIEKNGDGLIDFSVREALPKDSRLARSLFYQRTQRRYHFAHARNDIAFAFVGKIGYGQVENLLVELLAR